MRSDLERELVGLERAGWQAVVEGRARAHYGALLGRDALVLRAGLGPVSGEAALDALSEAPVAWFGLRAPRLVELGPDAAVLVYRLLTRRDFDTEQHLMVASTYRRDGGEWRLVLRQESTP